MTRSTISIRIDNDSLKKLENIVEKKGINRSAVVNIAIKKYINEYNLRDSKYTTISKTIEETSKHIFRLQNDIRSISRRLNIISRQVDNNQKRLTLTEKSEKQKKLRG